jgi:hypothetical protein
MPDAPPVIRASRPSDEAKLEDAPRIVRYDKAAEETSRQTLARRLRGHARSAADRLGGTATSLRSAVTDDLIPRARARIRDLAGLLARFVSALRARIDDKPRRRQVPRSQAARAHLKNTRRNRRRYLTLAAMVAGIVFAGWGIYLWAAGSVSDPAGAPVSESSPKSESGEETKPETPKAKPKTAAAAPLGSAESEIAVQGAPLPPEPVRGTSFGAKKVPGGEKYVLRMSNPVADMEGIIEDDGFSVTIPGSLSLSRAGPIASSHPDVEHASILNRGDFSELTVRFVAGRRPPYRVVARGPAIELTIAR